MGFFILNPVFIPNTIIISGVIILGKAVGAIAGGIFGGNKIFRLAL